METTLIKEMRALNEHVRHMTKKVEEMAASTKPPIPNQEVFDTIFRAAEKAWGIVPFATSVYTRKRDMKDARFAAWYYIRTKWYPMPFKQIGALTPHIYDHSTVIHGCQTIEDVMQTDKEIKRKYDLFVAIVEPNKEKDSEHN